MLNEALLKKITEMAKKYTESYIKEPTRGDYLFVENAALLGAALTLREINDDLVREREEKEKDLELPHKDYN